MKTTQIYLLVIGACMWASYTIHHDNYRLKQQEAQVHQLYCQEYSKSSSCKSN